MSHAEPLTEYRREQNYTRQEIARGGSSRRWPTPRQARRLYKKSWHAEVRETAARSGEDGQP